MTIFYSPDSGQDNASGRVSIPQLSKTCSFCTLNVFLTLSSSWLPHMVVNCGSCSMPKTCELNSLNCVGPAEGLGSLALTGMAPGGTEKGSTQRAKAGGDHNLIRTDHRARSLESMHFLKSQSTPNAAANLAIAGSLATLLYCTLRCHFHVLPVGCS